MRAILFASATVTSLTGRRARIPLVQAPAALFHWGARYTIEVAPRTSNLRICRLPALVIRPRRFFPPVGIVTLTSVERPDAACRYVVSTKQRPGRMPPDARR